MERAMLPPVRALSSSETTYTTTQQAPQSQEINAIVARLPLTATPALNTDASALARASILALSSQNQVSQSTAMLAETLGKMVNVPRNDGEPINGYIDRLTQTIRDMPASQRAALELQLSKLIQGMNLAMLTEVLKNPIGPDAARLTLLLEMSRFRGRDFGAKAVVSSYRQNTGTETGVAPRALVQPTAAPQSQPGRPGSIQTVTPTGVAPQGTSAPTSGMSTAGQSIQTAQTPVTTVENISTTAATSGNVLPMDDDAVPSKSSSASQALAENQQTARANLASADVKDQEARSPVASTINPPVRPIEMLPDTTLEQSARPVPQPTPQDTHPETSPVRTVQINDQIQTRNPTPSPYSNLVAETVKNLESQLLNALAGGRATPISDETATTFAPPQSATEISPDAKPAQPAVTRQTEDPVGEQLPVQIKPIAQLQTPTRHQVDAHTMMLEQPALQSAAAALMKDGTPLPFVGYPPAPDETEQDTPHRGRWPSSGDESGQDAQGEQQAQDDEQEERTAANDEDADAGSNASPNDEDGSDSAEAYYLRMAGFT
jgi:hypothetical protein